MDENDRLALEAYRNYWRAAFRHILQWPDEHAESFADSMYSWVIRSQLETLYLHEIAAWWIAPWAIDEEFLKRHSAELASRGIKTGARLQEVVAHLIQTSSGGPDEAPLEWQLARSKLEQFLLQFGERIFPPPTRDEMVNLLERWNTNS